MKKLLTTIASIAISYAIQAQVKLNIRPDMIVDEKAYPMSSPNKLFDEQGNITSEPPVGKPSTSWGDYINKDLYYPLSAVIDLGQEITISNIYIYDLGGDALVSFYAKSATGWEKLFDDKLLNWDAWNKHSVNKKTRFLRIVTSSPTGSFPEVVLYGDKQTIAPSYSTLSPKEYPALEDFLGLNILHINSVEKASIVKNIRQFHMWTWNEADMVIQGYPGFPNNKYSFNPSANGAWNFDDVYKKYKDKGLRITPALQGTAFWLFNNTGDITENKPVLAGEDPEKPSTYAEHADYMYQFSARYGKVNVPLSNLKLASNNTALTGQGTVEVVENWNEPNKTWKGRAGMFTPYEYAAMSSADYDGHEKTLGEKSGVKNADPNLPMAMAGLISMDTAFVKAMLFWCQQNRTDGKFPADILNFHHYSNDAGGQTGAPSFGISPEQDQLERKVKELVKFCRRNLPNKPIWISEFGYDVNQSSSQKAKSYGSFTGEDIQAMWLIRSFMAIYAGGADRAYMFWLSDGDSNSPEIFGTCGLLNNFPPAEPNARKSFYWLSTMNRVLGKYKLQSKNVTGNVHVAKFETQTNGDTTIYSIWNGTSNGTVTDNYTLNVEGTKATLISPKAGLLGGEQKPLAITNGSVKLSVTENPVYIKVFGKPATTLATEENVVLSEALVDLYPNPSKGISYLTVPGNLKVQNVNIVDVSGNLIKKYSPISNTVEINTSNLTSGVYTVQIQTSNNNLPLSKKLVVLN